MTSTLEDLAVIGRRVEFAYYRSLHDDSETLYLPGIITAITDDPASLRVRLDGQRSNLPLRPDYEGLRYLEQVVPVPDLPMGRFIPTVDDLEGVWEGVPLCSIGEDGDLIVLTGDRAKAIAAARTYLDEMGGVDLDYVDFDDIRAHWAVFEWQPEGAECPWLVDWDAAEGDDQAIRIHYLPA
jgi:hypothetical protein